MITGLQLAVATAAISIDFVLVIAGFAAADQTIAALDSGFARQARLQARIPWLHTQTIARTTVPGTRVPVITGFTEVQRAIATV